MRFAIINTADGAIRQTNEAFTAETLAQFNARLPEGQQAIECNPEVSLQHIYVDGQFVLPEPQPVE